MKNKIQAMNHQYDQGRIQDWLHLQDQEDDFLLGIVPQELKDIWEDEE